MPKIADRVVETTTTTGTGTLTLAGAKTGYRAFTSAFSNGDIVNYCILEGTGGSTAWEVGYGTFTTSGTTLTRNLLASSTGSLINLAAGTKDVFCTLPAAELPGKAVLGYWPAAAIKPATTNGSAALAWDESTTNKVMTGYLAFDAAAVEYGHFSFRAPQGLNELTMTAVFEWYEASGAASHDCVWQIEMLALSDADTIDTAWGTAVTVTDTGTSGTMRVSAETEAITPGNTWAAGDMIMVRVSRLATSGSDTLDVDAKLVGVQINATYATLVEP